MFWTHTKKPTLTPPNIFYDAFTSVFFYSFNVSVGIIEALRPFHFLFQYYHILSPVLIPWNWQWAQRYIWCLRNNEMSLALQNNVAFNDLMGLCKVYLHYYSTVMIFGSQSFQKYHWILIQMNFKGSYIGSDLKSKLLVLAFKGVYSGGCH